MPLAPMLAAGAKQVPLGPEWRYEVKWDGIRVVVAVARDDVHVWSRHGTVLTGAFPELASLADHLAPETILDGELVVCDGDGRPDFRRIRRRMLASRDDRVRAGMRSDPATLIVFDLLRDEGRDLTNLGWATRRERLEAASPPHGPAWTTNPAHEDGRATWTATGEHGLEGIVAKRVDAPYRPGKRSDAWVKVKHLARTALPVLGVREDAILVADARDHRPVAWVDRFHPSVDRGLLRVERPVRRDEVVGLCVVEHLATASGGLREPLVLALRSWEGSFTAPVRDPGAVAYRAPLTATVRSRRPADGGAGRCA